MAFGKLPEHAPRRFWSYSGQKLENSEPGHSVSWILRPTKHAQDVFHVRCLEELQTAIFYERNVSSGKFDLERGAVVSGAKQNCLALKVDTGFTVLQDALDGV